jgi:hypothetical protein
MVKGSFEMAKAMLAEGHPCNTSNDYSLSIYLPNYGGWQINVYPSEHYPFFTDMAVEHLFGIAQALGCRLCFQTENGVTICRLAG